MRWFWIDRFEEFESGRCAVAVKSVSLVEEQMDEYLPGTAVMPASLIIEGLAQTGGLLIGEHNGFRDRVVLAKVAKAKFHFPAIPGDRLVYTATIEDIQPGGGICRGVSRRGDAIQAEVDLMFAFLDDRFPEVDLFGPVDFLRMLRLLKVYDVGRAADGSRLEVPPYLLDLEASDLNS